MVDLSPGATVQIVNPSEVVQVAAPGLVKGIFYKEGPPGPTGAAGATGTQGDKGDPGDLSAAKAPSLDTTRVPDPQIKTSGGSGNTSVYTLSRITSGLPTINGQVIANGVETSRTGSLSTVIGQIFAGSKTQTDALRIPVTAGETLTAAAYVWTDQASARARMDILWFKSDGTASTTASTSGTYANFAGASTWEQRVTTATAPADAAYCVPQSSIATQSGNTVTGAKARMTAVTVASGTVTAPTYVDGETVSWAWSGSPHASTAKKVFYTSAEVDSKAQAKVDTHAAASDPHPSYLRKVRVPTLATNRALDPQMKTTGSASGSSFTLTRITTGLATGFTYGLKTVRTGTLNSVIAQINLAPGSGGSADALRIPVTPSEVLAVSAHGWTDQAASKARVDLVFYTAAGVVVSTISGTYSNIAQNTWETRSNSATVPATSAYVSPVLAVATQSGSATVTGAEARATGLMVVTGGTVPAYGDGETSGWDWTGTAHASSSSKLFASSADQTAAAGPLTLTKTGANLSLSRPFGTGTLVQTMSLTGSASGGFSLLATSLDGLAFHDTSDDITPIRTTSPTATVGANHGSVTSIVTTLWVDGKQITADGTYSAREVTIRESYLVVGNRSANTYRWTVSGCRVTLGLVELTPTNLGQCGAVQSAVMAASGYTVKRWLFGVGTVGGKDWSAGVPMDATFTATVNITSSDLAVAGRPPTVSLDVLYDGSSNPVAGFALGYLPYGARGDEATTIGTRLTHAPTQLWEMRDTKKSYPTFTTAEASGWGRLKAEGFRAYLDPTQVAAVLATGNDPLSVWEVLNTQANLAA